ncbi:MAG: SRPBCC family protein [Ktedonobacteraceae bacterium]|nr:SRPBCC family protein [Chloroflexota bacterium]
MASIHKEILIEVGPEYVWAAVRDVGAVHQRLVPGIVIDAYLKGDSRVVTFANGAVVRELIVDVDDEARRFVYAVVEGSLPFRHHQASIQVFAAGSGWSRVVWITDVVPDEFVARVSELVEQGTDVMKQTLEKEAAG